MDPKRNSNIVNFIICIGVISLGCLIYAKVVQGEPACTSLYSANSILCRGK